MHVLQFQKGQLDEFCKLHSNNTEWQVSLPTLYRHLLFDKTSEAMFCYVPKSGCTSLKVLFLANQGLMPAKRKKEILQKRVMKTRLANLNQEEKAKALQDYFKFVLVRNPLERVFSAYRDKIIRLPLSTLEDRDYNDLRKSIFQYNHPVEYEQWAEHVKANGSLDVSLSLRTFGDLVNYFIAEPRKHLIHLNEHFQPVLELCQPCLVRYDYYGNFKSYSDDVEVLMDKVHAPKHLLYGGYYSKNSTKAATGDVYQSYYKELSLAQKKALLRVLSAELDFYYHLFPEELDCHKEIMDTQEDIDRPYDPQLAFQWPSQPFYSG